MSWVSATHLHTSNETALHMEDGMKAATAWMDYINFSDQEVLVNTLLSIVLNNTVRNLFQSF
jgi:hypothetical protein